MTMPKPYLQSPLRSWGRIGAVTLAISLFSAAAPAKATVITYNNSEKDAFFNDLKSGAYFESFSSFGGQEVASPQSFSFGGDSYTLSDGATIEYSSITGGDAQASVYPTTLQNSESLVIDFTSGNITAVGGNFFLTNNVFDPIAGGDVTATLGTGEVVTQASSASYDGEPFTGFTSTVPITSLTITGPDLEDEFVTLDSLWVGQSFEGVPEPRTWALMLGGMALLLGFRRRLRA
jgi:hypothetical protein